LGTFDFAAGYTVTANSFAQSLVVTAHVATGSLILAMSTVLATRAVRLCRTTASRVPFEFTARGLAV
jgi:hypothetical protein